MEKIEKFINLKFPIITQTYTYLKREKWKNYQKKICIQITKKKIKLVCWKRKEGRKQMKGVARG